jgi:hypothetical protein
MFKYRVLVTLVISVSTIWLISGWQMIEAFDGIQQVTPEITPTATPVRPQSETSAGVLGPDSTELLPLIGVILLALAVVGVALAVIFMAAHKYSEWLNREMPQPIYTQEGRLLKVIEDSVKAIMQQTMGHDRVTGEERDVRVGIVEFERTANAGINLKLNVDKEVKPDPEGDVFKELLTYTIEADRWGRIKKMKQDGVPRYITVEKVTINGADEAEDDQETNGGQEPPSNGYLLPSGQNGAIDSFITQSDTMISITSRRKHWSQ